MAEAPARAFCAACPVTAQCLEEALRDYWTGGIWGGTNEKERMAIRRERGIKYARETA